MTVHEIPDLGNKVERAILGSLMSDGRPLVCRDVFERVTPEDFPTPAYSALFVALREVWLDLNQIDVAASAQQIQAVAARHPELHPQMADLFGSSNYSPELMPEYVQQLLHLARERRTAAAIEQMRRRPSDAPQVARQLADGNDARPGGPSDLVMSVADLIRDAAAADGTDGQTITPGVTTGWTNLDPYITIPKGTLSVVTGIPSHGKSTWLDALLVNLSEQHGWRHCIWTPESWHYATHHLPRLMQRRLGRPLVDKWGARVGPDEAAAAREWVGEHFVWLDPRPTRNHRTILAAADIAFRRRAYDTLILDPFTELEKPSDTRLHDFVGAFLTEVDMLTQRHNVATIIVAHPRKPDIESRGKPPTAYDIAESSHWANKPDQIVCIWRPDTKVDRVVVDVQKVRDRTHGRPGRAALDFHHPSYRFSEAPLGDER